MNIPLTDLQNQIIEKLKAAFPRSVMNPGELKKMGIDADDEELLSALRGLKKQQVIAYDSRTGTELDNNGLDIDMTDISLR